MSGANLRKFILFDANGRELELTGENNIPVALLDSNGRDLDLTTESNVPVALKDKNGLELEFNNDGSIPVRSRPQSSPSIILPLVKPVGSTTTTATATVNTYTITVTSAVGMVVGQHLRMVDDINDKFYFGEIVTIVFTTITLDTQIDFAYVSGSEVTFSDKNMAVDGSVTPQIFLARTGSLSIPSVVNITRILFTCITATAVSLSLFGDLPKLTRGLAFRVTRPTSQTNIFNVKNNEEIVNIQYDWTPYEATNPAQGVDGFSSRLTFGGESKIGTVIRLEQNDNLEMLVQDDLLNAQAGAQILRLIATIEGNIVQE